MHKIAPRRYDSLSTYDLNLFCQYLPLLNKTKPWFLEIGAASGNLSAALGEREKNAVLVGLDIEIATLMTFPGLKVCADGAHPPFADESFDLVLFSSALHHVLHIQQTLREAVRLLRHGGKLALVEPSARHPLRFSWKGWVTRFPLLMKLAQGHDDPSFRAEDLAVEIEKLGMKTEKIVYLTPRGANPGWRGKMQSALVHLLGKKTPRFLHSWFLYVAVKE